MEDIGALIFLAAMLWSIIGGIAGKRRKQRGAGAPPGREEPERSADSRREASGHADAGASAPAQARDGAGSREPTAADMIPQDLWEILTGERRARPPEPEPEPAWDETPAWGGETAWDVEAASEEPVPAGGYEVASWEEPPPHEPPIVVSLETPPPPPERRHRIFHERLDATAPPRRRARRVASFRGLGGRSSLRRAVVLREILGPPKGLE